jgi:broad specificity phosphatase PhoE
LLRSLLFAALLLPLAAGADEKLWSLLKKGGQVVLIRHAVTDPGVGDPPGFRLEDCTTQRNLSDAGRREARRLGTAIWHRAIPVGRVLSSRWCRCLETATLAFGGSQSSPTLDNLFGFEGNRERQLAAFRALVASAPAKGNLILVTHGSTTMAFTGVRPATTELVIVTPGRGGDYKLAGRLAIPE